MIEDPWDLDLGKFGTVEVPSFDNIRENFVSLSFFKKIDPKIVVW